MAKLEELDFAVYMADIGRDTAWMPIIESLSRQVKELESNQ